MQWGTRGWAGRASVAVAFAFVSAAVSVGSPAVAAGLPATPTQAQCETWLGPDLVADVVGRGYTFSAQNDSPGFSGTECWWGNPDSPRIAYFGFGIAELSAEAADAEAAELLATGDWASDPADPDVIRADQEFAPDQASFIDPSWRFQYADGYWIFVVDGEAEVLVGTDGTLDAWTDSIAETVLTNLEPEPEPVPEPEPEPEAAPLPDPGPTAAPAGFGADSPSALRGLGTIAEADFAPAALGGCLALAVVLVALVGLPGRLVDSALAERYGDSTRVPWSGWARTVESAVARLPRVVVIAGGLVVASVFAALIEPQLGWNPGSARLVLTLLASFVIENLLGLALVGWWLARRGHATRLQLKPGSLVIVLVSALLSRAVGFEPGFVFGLVLVLTVLVARTQAGARAQSLAESAWVLLLGIASWAGYSLAVAGSLDTIGVVGLFVTEVLSGLAVGCLSALPLLALPIRGMPGAELWRWRKRVWALVQGGAFAVFFVVVLPLPGSWAAVDAPFALWVGVFALYAVGAVILWLVIRFVPASRERASASSSRGE